MQTPGKVTLYCQVGRAIDMLDFSIPQALERAGMKPDIVFVCWKTSDEVYEWLTGHGHRFFDMRYDEGKGFLWNLYKGWNFGYEIAFREGAEYVCPIATDHAYGENWLANLVKHAAPNRIVNCKLIESGDCPSLHTTRNFGPATRGAFKQAEFDIFAKDIARDELVVSGVAYGHRLDAMPFLCARDVWERFGPMAQTLRSGDGQTGDSDFFDRCAIGGVEITKALDAVSYHCGAAETKINSAAGVYT